MATKKETIKLTNVLFGEKHSLRSSRLLAQAVSASQILIQEIL